MRMTSGHLPKPDYRSDHRRPAYFLATSTTLNLKNRTRGTW